MHRTMMLVILLTIFSYVYGDLGDAKNCRGAFYQGRCHEAQELLFDILKPFSLIVEYKTNMLYFSHESRIGSFKFISTSRINLDNLDYELMNNVPNGATTAVDRKTGDVYFGGCNGIYKLPHNARKNDKLAELNKIRLIQTGNNKCIQSLFFKNVLYYTDYPNKDTYIAGGWGSRTVFKDLENIAVSRLVIDDKYVMYYENVSGIFRQELGTKPSSAALVSYLYSDLRCLTLDAKGDVYVCFSDGIYKVNKDFYTLTEVLKLNDTYGVAFDKFNRMIYSTYSKIVRLNQEKVVTPKTRKEESKHNEETRRTRLPKRIPPNEQKRIHDYEDIVNESETEEEAKVNKELKSIYLKNPETEQSEKKRRVKEYEYDADEEDEELDKEFNRLYKKVMKKMSRRYGLDDGTPTTYEDEVPPRYSDDNYTRRRYGDDIPPTYDDDYLPPRYGWSRRYGNDMPLGYGYNLPPAYSYNMPPGYGYNMPVWNYYQQEMQNNKDYYKLMEKLLT